MAMAGPETERLIIEAFPDAHVVVVDLAGDGDHFAARIASEAFKGKSRIERHTRWSMPRFRVTWAGLSMLSPSRPPFPSNGSSFAFRLLTQLDLGVVVYG